MKGPWLIGSICVKHECSANKVLFIALINVYQCSGREVVEAVLSLRVNYLEYLWSFFKDGFELELLNFFVLLRFVSNFCVMEILC